MAVPITYTNINLSTKAPVKKAFKVCGDKAYYKIRHHCPTNVAVSFLKHMTIQINILNVYKLDFVVYPVGCPMQNLPILLETINPTDDLSIEVVAGVNTLSVYGVIPAGTQFRIYTNPQLLKYFECIELLGTVGVSNLLEESIRITSFDNIKVRYVPSRPSTLGLTPLTPFPPAPPAVGSNPLLPDQYPVTTPAAIFPWNEAIIPWKQNQPFPSGGGVIITPPFAVPPNVPLVTPPYQNGYNDQYDKFGSVPNSVIFYVGFDQDAVPPDSPNWTLFLTNFVDRGYSGDTAVDPDWVLANYKKKTYMAALTVDKMQFYLEKIDAFVNRAFSDVVVHNKPLTSSFQENLIKFFLNIHLGGDDYPDYVIKFFATFVEFVGIGDPNAPSRNAKLLYGNITSPKVFEYFRLKNIEVVAAKDESTIMYWWDQSGLSAESLVFESVHNIVAFSQFTNVVFSTVYVALHPTNPLNPALPAYPNFFTQYANAGSSNARLNVVRELYRILVPNSNSFSNVFPLTPDTYEIEGRHLHQSIMISNIGPPGTPLNTQLGIYFTFNPSQYSTESNNNLDGLEGLPVVDDFMATLQTSDKDQETVVDVTRPLIQIFPKPTYAPFGLGYRRCAGEILVYLVTEKLLAKFGTAEYEERAGTYPLVSVAPFKQVSDNIFVKPL